MKVQVAITACDFRFRHGVDEMVIPHRHNPIVCHLIEEAIKQDLEKDQIHPAAMRGMEELVVKLTAYAVSRAAQGWPVEGVEYVSPWETHDEAFHRRCAAMKTQWDLKWEDMLSSDPTTRNNQALGLLGLR